ncbi:FeoA family protein [Pleomorphomonas sp. NRK KF1]|uniref:FeoA family protein n=1 Tax=Pleomorphomonas sp. NRK KF1 TaxID=2943000 RepID=UPI002042D4F3|nr:FeoA family protein [Pleomorphomonas sp. NRK KF1]MCM5553986.1 ferrous iron transport protein A [Pleomorphomonas sp. NRK KF1]
MERERRSIPAIPLTMAREGQPLRIVDIDHGQRCRSRLADLGVFGGVAVTVVKGGGCGPLLLAINGSRIAIGAGLASKILVTDQDG